jgi:hypothetical protein
MRTLAPRTLLVLSFFCLALPGGLSAQEADDDKKAEKENPAGDGADERAPAGRAGERRRPDAPGARRVNPMARMFELMDPNGDGVITAKEMDEFIAKVDTDRDGRVNDDELRARMRSILGELRSGGFAGRPGGTGGSGGRSRGGRQRRSLDDPRVSKESAEAANALKKATHGRGLPGPGEAAPDFRLSLLEGSSAPDFVKPDGKGKVSLSGHKDKKPVVLIFGSYT